MRRFPAVEIRFTPEAQTAFDLHDRLVAGLDDFRPAAIEEAPLLWRVFFDTPAVRDAAVAWLRVFGDPRVTMESLDVEDEDWARRSQADLTPVRAGRFVVTPPWSAEVARTAARSDDLVIVIVPSMGFGTGHHASTRLCLELLQAIPVRGRAVLDIGTGSGVLAIAAVQLGAGSVTAIDNDPDAVSAAAENAALNGVEGRVRLACLEFSAVPDTSVPHTTVSGTDVVVANLTGQVLRRIAPAVVAAANPGGDAIVSGVLAEEEASVVAAFDSAGATLRARTSADEWVALHFHLVRGQV